MIFLETFPTEKREAAVRRGRTLFVHVDPFTNGIVRCVYPQGVVYDENIL